MPIHPARYATPTNPPEKQNPSTVKMRTTATSQPYACDSAMQTPAICRPACGRTSGRLVGGGATFTPAPQFEQNRAVAGNPVPQR